MMDAIKSENSSYKIDDANCYDFVINFVPIIYFLLHHIIHVWLDLLYCLKFCKDGLHKIMKLFNNNSPPYTSNLQAIHKK
jgi:hypothetical protein